MYCVFRIITQLYPHYWTVPASGKAEISRELSSRKSYIVFCMYFKFDCCAYQCGHSVFV